MKILVLDGNENQAVACVRSLARAGHRVAVGASTSWSKAGWSRFAESSFTYPAPQDSADRFVACIRDEAAREPGTLVLPATERTTLPLSAYREEIFAAGGRMVLPSHETVLRAFDKRETTRLASSLGIATPKTFYVTSSTEAREIADSISYPAVIKARSSEQVSASGKVVATGAPLYARNAGELLTALEQMSLRSSVALVQEYVEGEGTGYFALMREGELRLEFAHRRIRDVRPTGSGSAVRESARPDPRMREAALRILQALRWHGVAMVEFRVRPDGTPVFMEVNGRFWNSLPLSVYAGADFPARLAEMAERGDARAASGYRLGVRCRWMLGDARHLLEVWRGAPEGYAGKYPGRLRATLDFLTPVGGTYHDNFMLSDPLPELGDWLDFALRRVPAQFKKSEAELEARGSVNVERRYSRS
ncbi:MAG TPA: acetate--CoA ligase family protein [Blastocatellia bacterium]|nr:acetate--CoA ligase family protein [Blastocatellia bacterium]